MRISPAVLEARKANAYKESSVERVVSATEKSRVPAEKSTDHAPDTDRKIVEKITDIHKATPAERAYAGLDANKVPEDPSVCTSHNPTGEPVKRQPVIERWDGIVRSDPSQREADKAVGTIEALLQQFPVTQ